MVSKHLFEILERSERRYLALQRFIKSGAFAVAVWIAMSEPIAADFDRSTAALAETFPSGFVALDSIILYRLNYFEKTELLICQIMFELCAGTAARGCLAASEASRKNGYDLAALAAADPFGFSVCCRFVTIQDF